MGMRMNTGLLLKGAPLCAMLFIASWRGDTRAQAGPVLPCGVEEPVPAYPELGAASVERYWQPADVSKDWTPPPCTAWAASPFAGLVTTVARFRHTGNADSMLRRIGAISDLAGVRYWSPTHGKWQTLIVEATALGGPSAKLRRGDFAPDELRSGGTVYFEQTDNLMGKAIYRLRVLESSEGRVVFTIENESAMRYLLFTLLPAGGMQTIHFLERETPGVWRYYGIVRTGEHASKLLTAHPASSINRAVAFFRHYAGIPYDLEPPGAPDK